MAHKPTINICNQSQTLVGLHKINQPRCWLIIYVTFEFTACWQPDKQHLRYCLCDSSGYASAEQVYTGFHDEDVGVVGGGPAEMLGEVFQAEALQGAKSEE